MLSWRGLFCCSPWKTCREGAVSWLEMQSCFLRRPVTKVEEKIHGVSTEKEGRFQVLTKSIRFALSLF